MRRLSILSWCLALAGVLWAALARCGNMGKKSTTRTFDPASRTLNAVLPESRFDEKDQAHQSGARFD